MIKETELEYTASTLATLAKDVWGENSTEFLAGALATVVSLGQMTALINHLKIRLSTREKP